MDTILGGQGAHGDLPNHFIQPDQPAGFQVMQQFVVAPDRRYRVEIDDDTLHFTKTGSQFDAEWAARGANAWFRDSKVGNWLKRVSPKKLLFTGIALAVGAILLLAFVGGMALYGDVYYQKRKLYTAIAVLVFAFVFGTVMIMSGISGRRGNSGAGHAHNFSLFQTQILGAELLEPQSELARRGEPQVARVHLSLAGGKKMKLAIPTEEDFAGIQRALPGLLEEYIEPGLESEPSYAAR